VVVLYITLKKISKVIKQKYMMKTPEKLGDATKTTTEEQNKTKTPPALSPENQSFFNRMSEGAKKIANEAYKGIGADRMLDKMRIGRKQDEIDWHQREAVRLKSEMDSLDSKISELDQAREDIESNIEEFRQKNILGVESLLQLEIQRIEQQKTKLQNDKDSTQSKLEERGDKIRLYTNERDRIANRLIGRYKEKLGPMEVELEKLKTIRGEIGLRVTGAEIKRKEEFPELGDIEKEIRRSDEEVRKNTAIKYQEYLERIPPDHREKVRREKVRVEKENLVGRRAEIAETDRKIAEGEDSGTGTGPMEVELEELKTIRGEIGLRVTGAEIKRKEEFPELGDIEKEIRRSDEEVRKNTAIKYQEYLERIPPDHREKVRREKVRVEKENLVGRRAEIAETDRKIAEGRETQGDR